MKPGITIIIGALAAVLLPSASWSATEPTATSAGPEFVIPADLKLSRAARDVEKMATSGVSEDVIKTYIESSPYAFNLSADNIIQMQGTGVSGGLMSEMLTHDKKIADQAAASQPPFPSAPPSTAPYPYPYPAAEAAQPVNPVSTYTIPADTDAYYSGLAPYGSWGYLPDYGWCWQPSIGLGYAYYPWGILRYGRWWNCPGRGWVWFPGAGFRGTTSAFGGRGYAGTARFGGGGFAANRSVSVTHIGGGSHFAGGFARGGVAGHFSGGHSVSAVAHSAGGGAHR